MAEKFVVENIPAELKSLPRWVCYGTLQNPKAPVNANTGGAAKSNEPATWATFERAVEFAAAHDCGVGFVTGAGYCCLDFDDVKGNKNRDVFFKRIWQYLDNSYVEISPSGNGFHIWVKVTNEQEFLTRQKPIIEIYHGGQYCTVTGRSLKGSEIKENTAKVMRLYERYKDKVNYTYTSTQAIEYLHKCSERLLQPASGGGYICPVCGWDGGKQGNGITSKDGVHYTCWGGGCYTNADIIDIVGLMNGIHVNDTEAFPQKLKHACEFAGILLTADSEQPESEVKPEASEPSENLEELCVSSRLNGFLEAVQKNREGKPISTGFSELDGILNGGLMPGLYFVGAVSSLGKTTFCQQVCDNIAKSGGGVLIFSLEMSAHELMAKTLSRESMRLCLERYKDTSYAKTTAGVLRGVYNSKEQELLRSAIQRYESWGKNLYISEGVGNIGVAEIKSKVTQFIKKRGVPPVILIDYLQILAPFDMRASDKQNTDKAVLELKRMSRDLQIPVIGISSFNRENYNAPVNMASFKESGAIEYSSDVLIGLQYKGMDYEKGEKESERLHRLSELRRQNEKVAGQGGVIQIQLKVLKHRNGRKGSIGFEFFPLFNYFREKGAEA